MASLPTRRRYKFANAPVVTTLAAGMTSSDTTFTITTSTNWPSAASDSFWVTIGAGTTTEERILCSGTSGTTVTVSSGGRGQDGTTATAHNQGDTVWVSWSATDADEANAHVSASGSTSAVNVHGLASGSSVVGTSDTQEITNKTFVSPKIKGASGGSTIIAGATGTPSNTVTLPAATGVLVSTGDSAVVTGTMIAATTITDTNIAAGANIATGKIASTLTIKTLDSCTLTNSAIGSSSYLTNNGTISGGTINGNTVSINGLPLPIAFSSGQFTVSVSGAPTGSVSITYPTSRFSQVPIVTAVASMKEYCCSVTASSSTGCTITVRHVDNTVQTTTLTVYVMAIQQTSSAYSTGTMQ